MIMNSRLSEQATTVQELADKYAIVLTQNYDKQEHQLLDSLFREVKLMKRELAFFKKEVSSDNIQKLIIERRREKERERDLLENRWRQCNQSFKALQEEQKKLINQQKEDAFDVKHLQTKIEQFRTHIAQAKAKLESSNTEKQTKFLTEAKQNYQSPYKISTTTRTSKASKDHQKLLDTSSPKFFTNKYRFNKCVPLKSNFEKSVNLGDVTNSTRFQNSFTRAKQPKINLQATQRENNLQQFLNDPSIRLKLFKIFKKQI